MERRVTSHTEEEEMNQRRHLLELARKGDEKAVNQLMELYQVRVYSGDSLKSMKIRKSLPVLSPPKPKEATSASKAKPVKRHKSVVKNPKATPKVTGSPASKTPKTSASSKPKTKISPKKQAKRPLPVRKAKATPKVQSSPKKLSLKVASQGVVKKGVVKKGVVKKESTRKPTSKTRVQPRIQAKSKAKAQTTQTKMKAKTTPTKVKAKPKASRKATSTPAIKTKRSR